MKKVLIIAAAIFISTTASAQFTIKGGMNFSNVIYGSELKKDMKAYEAEYEAEYGEDYYGKLRMTPGFKLMGTYEFGLSDFFSIETGLGLSSKGTREVYKYDETSSEGYTKSKSTSKMNLLYGHLPLKAKFSFDAGETRLSIAAGGYFGAGILAMSTYKYKYKSEYNGERTSDSDTERDIDGFGDTGLSRLDYGLTSAIGIEYKKVLFEVTYDYGFANIVGDFGDYYTYKNSVLGLSVGYRFGK